MAWEKPPQELVTFFSDYMIQFDKVEHRKMFGHPCAFSNTHMFTGIFQDGMFLRLSDSDREAIKTQYPATEPFIPMPGRTMKQYVLIPKVLMDDPNELKQWIEKSLSYVRSLPPKVKKTRKKKES